MEHLLAAILLSLSTNTDNLAVGIAYGIKQVSISLPANGCIALLSGLSTFTAMAMGTWFDRFLSPPLARELGSGLLIAIGCFTLWTLLRSRFGLASNPAPTILTTANSNSSLEDPHFPQSNLNLKAANPHFPQSNLSLKAANPHFPQSNLSLKAACILGLALTLTNFGTGIGAGMAQLDPLLTSSFSTLSSLLTIGGGAWLGNGLANFSRNHLEFPSGLANFSRNRLEFLSGLLLIALGLYEYFFA